MFRRQQEIEKVEKVKTMQDYNYELSKDGMFKAHQEDILRRQKQTELEAALHNRATYDHEMHKRKSLAKQRQLQMAEEYERAMRDKQRLKEIEKQRDMELERMNVQKAQNELRHVQEAERQKKDLIYHYLVSDRPRLEDLRKNELGVRETLREQEKRDIDLSEKMARERDRAFNARFNQFEEFQKKIMDNYQAQGSGERPAAVSANSPSACRSSRSGPAT